MRSFVLVLVFVVEGVWRIPGSHADRKADENDEEMRKIISAWPGFKPFVPDERWYSGRARVAERARKLIHMEAEDREICVLSLYEKYSCIFCSSDVSVRHKQVMCNELLPPRIKLTQMSCVGLINGFDMSMGWHDKDTFSIGCALRENLDEIIKCTTTLLLDVNNEYLKVEEEMLAEYSHCLHTLATSVCCGNHTETKKIDQYKMPIFQGKKAPRKNVPNLPFGFRPKSDAI